MPWLSDTCLGNPENFNTLRLAYGDDACDCFPCQDGRRWREIDSRPWIIQEESQVKIFQQHLEQWDEMVKLGFGRFGDEPEIVYDDVSEFLRNALLTPWPPTRHHQIFLRLIQSLALQQRDSSAQYSMALYHALQARALFDGFDDANVMEQYAECVSKATELIEGSILWCLARSATWREDMADFKKREGAYFHRACDTIIAQNPQQQGGGELSWENMDHGSSAGGFYGLNGQGGASQQQMQQDLNPAPQADLDLAGILQGMQIKPVPISDSEQW